MAGINSVNYQSFKGDEQQQQQQRSGMGLTIPGAIAGGAAGFAIPYWSNLGKKDSDVTLETLTKDTFEKVKRDDLPNEETKKAYDDLKDYVDSKATETPKTESSADAKATETNAEGSTATAATETSTKLSPAEVAKNNLDESVATYKRKEEIKGLHEKLTGEIQESWDKIAIYNEGQEPLAKGESKKGLGDEKAKLEASIKEEEKALNADKRISSDARAKKQEAIDTKKARVGEIDKKILDPIDFKKKYIDGLATKAGEDAKNARDAAKIATGAKNTAKNSRDAARKELAAARTAKDATKIADAEKKLAGAEENFAKLVHESLLKDTEASFYGKLETALKSTKANPKSTTALGTLFDEQTAKLKIGEDGNLVGSAVEELDTARGKVSKMLETLVNHEENGGKMAAFQSRLETLIGKEEAAKVANNGGTKTKPITEALTKAFETIKGHMPKEVSSWKVAIGTAIGAVVLGGIGYLLSGKKSENQ